MNHFERPDPRLMDQVREVARCYSASCVFADVQQRGGVMHSSIKPIFNGKAVGPAVTVKLSPGDLQDPLLALHAAHRLERRPLVRGHLPVEVLPPVEPHVGGRHGHGVSGVHQAGQHAADVSVSTCVMTSRSKARPVSASARNRSASARPVPRVPMSTRSWRPWPQRTQIESPWRASRKVRSTGPPGR